MKKEPSKRDLFERLDWDDLDQWAGSRVLSRGQGYQHSHRVKELAQTQTGALVAWVYGGQKYATEEEFECAKFIDNLPEVKYWVRNLPGPGREDSSFWLQTSTDKFYPDFVCQLTDDKQIVVEHKNAKDWSDEDSAEKRNLGELWEERSGGKCLFVMPKGINDLESIRAKINK